jgi:hypothetical protein
MIILTKWLERLVENVGIYRYEFALNPCSSPRSEVETRTLSREIVVSGGSNNSSQNSGRSVANQSPLYHKVGGVYGI